MDRGSALLSVLVTKLRPWFPYVIRATHANSVGVVSSNTLGEFVISVDGVGKDNSPWQVQVPFTRELCFGPTYLLTPAAWHVVQRPCDHARRIVKEVLTQRGVL